MREREKNDGMEKERERKGERTTSVLERFQERLIEARNCRALFRRLLSRGGSSYFALSRSFDRFLNRVFESRERRSRCARSVDPWNWVFKLYARCRWIFLFDLESG